MNTIGTSQDVIRSFARFNLAGVGGSGPCRTASAQVPGGRRLQYVTNDARGVVLYSYRTEVAVRLPDGRYAVTTARYGPSTGKALGRLRRALADVGMFPTGEYVIVDTAVPGRHGGYGIPWHPTGRQPYAFEVWGVA